jgi:hypothetical protein
MRKIISASFSILFLFANLLLAPSARAENLVQPAAYFKTGVCGLTVDDAHISTYLLRLKKGRQVKINVFSKCGLPQQRVSFTVEIWKQGLLGDHKMRTFRKTFLNPMNPRLVRYESAKLTCKNYLPTIYYGRAQARALIGGKEYVSPWVISEHLVPIDCGT